MCPLESFNLFSLLSAEELDRLRGVSQEVNFPAGREIFREGDKGDGLYLVRAGLVQISAVVGQSDRQVISKLGPGEMFGEMAVLDSQPRSASAAAEETTDVYFLPREPVLAMLRGSPDTCLRMMQEITRRLREFNHQYVRRVIQAERMALVGRFASSIMHDLKNPLTIIGIAADLACQESATTENRQLYQGRIRKQVARINSMVTEVMEFTRGGTGRLALAPTDYALFVRTVVDEIQKEVSNKGITVAYATPPPEVRVNLNPDRLGRVFYNLMFNAVDAMPEGGGILLRFALAEGVVATEIEDTGSGIAPEMIGKLFEPFATHGKPRGTGLGLSIARRIVEEHRGRMYARNVERGGALFGFTLPVFGPVPSPPAPV